jgi:hypothetical protein
MIASVAEGETRPAQWIVIGSASKPTHPTSGRTPWNPGLWTLATKLPARRKHVRSPAVPPGLSYCWTRTEVTYPGRSRRPFKQPCNSAAPGSPAARGPAEARR